MTSRVVLITGGTRGIGAAMVEAFAKQGDKVAFFYRSSTEKAQDIVGRTGAMSICCDVSDSEAVKRGVTSVQAALGEIDVLICNAGVSSTMLLQDTSDEEWRRVMGTNLDGAFYACREVLHGMIRAQSGNILLISSIWGRIGASMEVAYSASKAGMIGLCKALAKEVGPSGIRVNCIAPGIIDTDMNAHLGKDVIEDLAATVPLGRIGEADEIARTALYLCSPDASYITGQVIGADGGGI